MNNVNDTLAKLIFGDDYLQTLDSHDDMCQGNSGKHADTNTITATPTTIMWNCPDACYLGEDGDE